MKLKNDSVSNEPGDSEEWHALDIEQVCTRLSAKKTGLTDIEANKLISKYGKNILHSNGGEGFFHLLIKQINNPITGVLVLSAILAFFFDPHGGTKNAIVIAAVVALNALIGFFQEFRANQAIRSLSQMVPHTVYVLRNGERVSKHSSDIVPGDIVFLNSGDKVPGDIRIFECSSFRTDESALTGESLPVEKSTDPVAGDAVIGDRTCMAYAGTFATYGSAAGIVVSTGMRTELGKISAMIASAENVETPLSKSLSRIGKGISIFVAVLSVLILIIGMWRELSHGAGLLESFQGSVIFAIALAVGAIPEGLPAMITVILAIGVMRMAKRNAIIRHLPAVETLGSTTVICSDKTGTLTRNRMTVSGIWVPNDSIDRSAVLRAAVLCSDATVSGSGESAVIHGDPTEGAIIEAAVNEGHDVSRWRESFIRGGLIPFESDYQYMAVADQGTVYMKGSPEAVLSRCSIRTEDKNAADAAVHSFAEKGMRVLAVAQAKRTGGALDHHSVSGGLSLIGLIAMIDPPRPEAIEAIRVAQQAGITVKMITGDHRKTATAIGHDIGLGGSPAVEGVMIAKLSDNELSETAISTNVFARVAPEHKLRLVRALQRTGQVVAMTGDGVNDAPALKQADIGIAMGITGTSVSKEAADIILLDDNFATIKSAIEEGRRIYDNLIKSLSFLLPTNLCFAFLFAFSVAFFPFHPETKELIVPLSPIQLFWINLISSLLLGTPLAFEPAESDIMRRPPRQPDAPVFGFSLAVRTVLVGGVMAACCIYVFLNEYNAFSSFGNSDTLAMAKAQSIALNTIVMLQIWYLFESRSVRKNLFCINPFSNVFVLAGVGILILLQLVITQIPAMNMIFGTAPLSIQEWGIALIFGAAVLPVTMIEKILVFRSK